MYGSNTTAWMPSFTLSTTPEPFGQVVAEAMAFGVPVIASTIGGPSEFVTNGVDALTAAPRDVPGLATAMATLADDRDLRQRLSIAGRRTAEMFAPDFVANQFDSFIEEMVALDDERTAARRWKRKTPVRS